MKEKYKIIGMTCAACKNSVEKSVKKLSGIKSVNVNLMTNIMLVDYDEKILNKSKIFIAVKSAGYDISENIGLKENISITKMRKRLLFSIIFLVPLMYVAMGSMLMLPLPSFLTKQENYIWFLLLQIILVLPIIVLNFNYFKVGFKRLFKLDPNMDSLIAIGSSSAFIYGIISMIFMIINNANGGGSFVDIMHADLYFEATGTILTLVTLGKYFEEISKGKTSDSITKLINLAPKTTIIKVNNVEVETLVSDVKVGDLIVIKPGMSLPVDGIIVEGNSSINQSLISGESLPVEVSKGSKVLAGTINKNGHFIYKAELIGEDTTLSRIISLVEEASNSKAPISRLADKISGIFVPVVIVISLITLVIWLLIGKDFEFSLSMAISVLVISCPCALGLATPVAIMVATGKGAENGILIKRAEALEMLNNIDVIAIDKTGTITKGEPKVVSVFSLINERELLGITSAIERKSEHPLADAIVQYASDKDINDEYIIEEFKAISGRGVFGIVNGNKYLVGNRSYLEENGITLDIDDSETQNGVTSLYIAKNDKLIGIIGVSDVLKEGSLEAIKRITERGIEVIMITGDSKTSAKSIASKVNIDRVYSEMTPEQKSNVIKDIQDKGLKVAMCGDGINDAPSLMRADVGIAIGSGTDIAIESADIVLVRNDLLDVYGAIELSHKTINNIKLSLFWAFIYNIIGIPIAAGIFYQTFSLKLNPMISALAMSFSSVCVVLNALRLKSFRINKKEEKFMKKEVYIEGMMCEHCKKRVEEALKKIDGVIDAEVILKDGKAIISFSKAVSEEEISKAISDAGYDVKEI